MNSTTPNQVKVIPPERPGWQVAVKRMVQAAVWLWVLPRLLLYWTGRRVLGRRALSAASESIARIPGMRGVYMRQAFYGSVLDRCGQDITIGWGSVFSMTEARIGERAYIGRNCNIGFGDIGCEVMLADSVVVLSGGREHDSDSPGQSMHEQGHTYCRVRIGDGAWVGAGAIVMADIGEHAIVGAGAVVNRPIPPGAVAVGVPAKVVKYRAGYEPSTATD